MKIFALILLLSSFTLHSALASEKVYFSPNGGAKEALLKELKVEKVTSLDVAIYSLSDRDVIKRLKAIAGNDVPVRLVLNAGGRKANREKAESLENAGIDVRYVTQVMHHKFGIINRKVLVTGSMNWSSSANSRYDEDFLVYKRDRAKINAYQREFDFLWEKSKDFKGAAGQIPATEPVTTTDDTTIFTSENFEAIQRNDGSWRVKPAIRDHEKGVAGMAVVKAIKDAKVSIKMAQSYFLRRDVYLALLDAHKNGVLIEIALDQKGYSSKKLSRNPSPTETKLLDEFLAKKGVTVKYKKYSRYWKHQTAKQMHSKYTIIDDEYVLTGSFNLSKNAEINTFENLNYLDGPIVEEYVRNHKKIMEYRKGELDDLIAEIKDNDGKSPCHYQPITLSGPELNKLNKAYKRGACRGGR